MSACCRRRHRAADPRRSAARGPAVRGPARRAVAADGEVLSGQSAVDRSMMTGESVPVDASAGDAVTGGTIALTGRMVVRADRVGPDTQLARLIAWSSRPRPTRPAIQRLADRVCASSFPAVLACAALTLAGWLLAGGPAVHAFSAALAVLIIACPCALGLATPAALVAASGRGAQLGIFIKGYQALESSRAIDTVVLDKTGTVTTGRMTVAACAPPPASAASTCSVTPARSSRPPSTPWPPPITAAARADGGAAAARPRASGAARPRRPRDRRRSRGHRRAGAGCSPTAAWPSRPTWPAGAARGAGRPHHRAGRLGRRGPRRARGRRHGQALRGPGRRRPARASACARSC